MGQLVEANQGEILIKFQTPLTGKLTFSELGISNKDLLVESGFLRLVFDFEGIGAHHYFQVPTISITYAEKAANTHWQCDFNGVTILDKTDHFGNSTVILLNREKIASLEHHHQNKLILHAEFPSAAQVLADESFVTFFN
jgi:hypothetical protein